MFEPKYSNQAAKFIKKIDSISRKRILNQIESLMENPVVHDTKRVEGTKEKLFRVRVGDFRILYEVDYSSKIMGIIRIDKRERVYEEV